MRLNVAGLALAGALAFAQSTPHFEIRGSVTELGTNFGLAGMQVNLLSDGSAQPIATVSTDTQGAFLFQPDGIGHYTIEVKLNGYLGIPPGTLAGIPLIASVVPSQSRLQSRVVLTNGNPQEGLHFTAFRPAELKGRVVDAETDKPLAKVPVAWVSLSTIGGRRTWSHGMPVATGEDGQFLLKGLPPGNYAVETLPRVLGAAQLMTQFSEDDAKIVDQDFEKSFWPGGRDLESAALVPVGSGQSLSVGTIKVRSATYYRVHARFTPANCPPGVKAAVDFGPPVNVGGDRINGEIACGADFMIRNVPPGSYQLVLSAGRMETHAQAAVPVVVADKNVGVSVTLQRGVDVDGLLVVADGAGQPPLNEATIMVLPAEGRGGGNALLNPDEQGRFHLVNVPLGAQAVEVPRMIPGYYLREIRYNGHAQSGTSFTLDGNSAAHSLELVIDNKPGAISGVVEDSDHPVNKAYVVAAKWPLISDMLATSTRNAASGDDGKFRLGGLSPGEYRVLAVPEASKDRLNEPGVLERLLFGAEKVTIDRGGVADTHLKLTDPTR